MTTIQVPAGVRKVKCCGIKEAQQVCSDTTPILIRTLSHTKTISTLVFAEVKMLSLMFFVCLSLCVYSADSSLSCRWMEHKFRQYSETSLDLLDAMVSGLLLRIRSLNHVWKALTSVSRCFSFRLITPLTAPGGLNGGTPWPSPTSCTTRRPKRP